MSTQSTTEAPKLYTIGFSKKNARTLFAILQKANVSALWDIRLNNTSQLSGYTKKDDLAFFCEAIAGIQYVHQEKMAPTAALFDGIKKKKLGWDAFRQQFTNLLVKRNVTAGTTLAEIDGTCLLCSEVDYQQCHRSLVALYLKEAYPQLELVHL